MATLQYLVTAPLHTVTSQILENPHTNAQRCATDVAWKAHDLYTVTFAAVSQQQSTTISTYLQHSLLSEPAQMSQHLNTASTTQ